MTRGRRGLWTTRDGVLHSALHGGMSGVVEVHGTASCCAGVLSERKIRCWRLVAISDCSSSSSGTDVAVTKIVPR